MLDAANQHGGAAVRQDADCRTGALLLQCRITQLLASEGNTANRVSEVALGDWLAVHVLSFVHHQIMIRRLSNGYFVAEGQVPRAGVVERV